MADYGPPTNVSSSNSSTGLAPSGEHVATSIFSDRALTIVYVTIGSIAMLGNLLVVSVMANNKLLRKTLVNIYIINQSVIDGGAGLILVLSWTLQGKGEQLDETSIADVLYCKLWLSKIFLWSLMVSSTYNLVATTFERYLSVVHPVWYMNNASLKHVKVSMVFIWVAGFLFQLPVKVATSAIVDGSCSFMSEWPSLFVRQFVGVIAIIYQFVVPLVLLCFFYAKMAWEIHKKISKKSKAENKTQEMGSMPSDRRQGGENGFLRARHNIIKTLVLVGVSFFLCWIINQTYFLFLNLGFKLSLTSTFYHLTVMIAFSNCMVNPFIYIVKYEQFKVGFRSFVGRVTRSYSNKVNPSETLYQN